MYVCRNVGDCIRVGGRDIFGWSGLVMRKLVARPALSGGCLGRSRGTLRAAWHRRSFGLVFAEASNFKDMVIRVS